LPEEAVLRAFATLWLLLYVLLIGGCAKNEPAGHPVSGTVTFQGKPLDQGSIEFSPTGDQGTMSGGDIKDGNYSIPAASGLKPGPYAVRISSSDRSVTATEEAPGEPPPPARQRIPAKFNEQTTLTAEVTETGDNKFDFNIP
jgi:hypothetical protein